MTEPRSAAIPFIFVTIVLDVLALEIIIPVLPRLIALFGLGFDYIIMALAPTIGWLFVGRVISGICGAGYTAAGAYIAVGLTLAAASSPWGCCSAPQPGS